MIPPRGASVPGALAAALLVLAAAAPAAGQTSPNLVPWPRSLALGSGCVEVGPTGRIVAEDPGLAPLASVLADELYFSTAVRPATAGGPARPGDIALRLNPGVRAEEGYRLAVGPTGVAVEGRTYRGAAWGTATLLEAVEAAGGLLRVPRPSHPISAE